MIKIALSLGADAMMYMIIFIIVVDFCRVALSREDSAEDDNKALNQVREEKIAKSEARKLNSKKKKIAKTITKTLDTYFRGVFWILGDRNILGENDEEIRYSFYLKDNDKIFLASVKYIKRTKEVLNREIEVLDDYFIDLAYFNDDDWDAILDVFEEICINKCK